MLLDTLCNQDEDRQPGVPVDDDAFNSTTSDDDVSPELQQELDRAALMAKASKNQSTAPQRSTGTSEGDDLIDVEASAKGKKTLREQLQSKMVTLAMTTVVRPHARMDTYPQPPYAQTKSKQALAASRVASKQALDKSRTVVTSLQDRRQDRRTRRAAPSPAPVEEVVLHQD